MKQVNILDQMNQLVAGDHLVLLYDDREVESNIEVITSYIFSRLNKNEKCIYISNEIETDPVIQHLNNSPISKIAIDTRQLLILSRHDVYSKGGKFVPEKMIALLKDLSQRAIEDGYNAFAITGEISWVLEYEDGFERIMHYEYLLNELIFDTYPVSAICRYNIDKFTSSMIRSIIEVHPIIIWNSNLHENPFYFSLENTKDIDVEKFQVASMLNAIENFSQNKSRFRDEIEIQEVKYQKLQLNILNNIIKTLTGLLGIHDEYTKYHSQNVATVAEKIARCMNLEDKTVVQIYYAGLVHDIGKALIPVEIINKNGRLTPEEFSIVKKHPTIGYEALLNSKELTPIANIVLEHHERWDGKGYPNGIEGEDIRLESRILAIADSFDAMISDRPYRKAFTTAQAIEEIRKNSDHQFDPNIVSIAIDKVFNQI